MKLSDYVADFLSKQGIRHVFTVTGGASAHLIDSVARHPDIEYICPHCNRTISKLGKNQRYFYSNMVELI